MKQSTRRILTGLVFAAVGLGARLDALALSQPSVELGTAGDFAVLGASTVTSTGDTTIEGDLGVSPGTAVVGFPPGIVDAPGTIHAADALAVQAQDDLTAAYTNAAGRASDTDLTGQDLGGLTLTAGVYHFDTSAQLTGYLTLDAQGDPNAVWIFQIGTTLITASSSQVNLIGKAQSCHIFWQVGSSATLGTDTHFAGNILSLSSITLNTRTTVDGRILARTGAVTLDSNILAVPCGIPILVGVPADTNASCDNIPEPAQVNASNACSTQSVLAVMSETLLSGACANTYTLRRVWTASNLCGDSISATQLIAVADTTAPVILSGPEDVTVQCLSDVPAVDTNLVTATDNCGGVTITHEGDTPLTNGCGGMITRTYRATDECGNFTNYTQLITVDNTTPPAITGPQSPIVVLSNQECQGTVPDLRSLAQISNSCGGTNGLTVTQAPPGGSTFTTQTDVTLTVTDLCGNTNACTVSITTPCATPFQPGFTIDKTMTNLYFEAGTTNARPPLAGELLNFTITIVNTGNVELATIPVRDSYDTNQLLFVSATPPSDGNAHMGDITWTNVGPLQPGASSSIVVSFTAVVLTTNSPFGTNIVVAAPTTAPGYPPVGVLTGSAPYRIGVPCIALSKTVSATGAVPGDKLASGTNGTPIVYTFVVRNTGDSTLTNVTVIDNFIGYTNVLGTMAAGGSATVTVNRAITGALLNRATVTGMDALGQAYSDTSTAQVEVTGGVLQFQFAAYNMDESHLNECGCGPALKPVPGTIFVYVTRTGTSSAPASVNFATSNGTAVAGIDYTALLGTLTWQAGNHETKRILVQAIIEPAYRGSRTFQIILTDPRGVSLGTPSSTTVTILDDNPLPILSFTPSALYSVNQASGTARVFVRRAGGTGGACSICFSTANGTAQAGLDYTATFGTLNWTNGEKVDKWFDVPIADDMLCKGNETLKVRLSGVIGEATMGNPSMATITIIDHVLPRGKVQFATATFSAVATAQVVQVSVRRMGGAWGGASVKYATVNGTARSGLDYAGKSGTLTWGDGDATDKLVVITICTNRTGAGSKSFKMTLTSAMGAGVGAPAVTTITLPHAVPALTPAAKSISANRGKSIDAVDGSFAAWLVRHGLTGDPVALFGLDCNGDGIPNGAKYAFGSNLMPGESLLTVRDVDGLWTAEVPVQEPSTLWQMSVSVEASLNPDSGTWSLPVVQVPSGAATPVTRQWYQSPGTRGQKVFWRVVIALVKGS